MVGGKEIVIVRAVNDSGNRVSTTSEPDKLKETAEKLGKIGYTVV